MKPAYNYPTTYRGSTPMIEITDDEGRVIIGTGMRTGMAIDLDDAPVYRLHSFGHADINGKLFALTPTGLVERCSGAEPT